MPHVAGLIQTLWNDYFAQIYTFKTSFHVSDDANASSGR